MYKSLIMIPRKVPIPHLGSMMSSQLCGFIVPKRRQKLKALVDAVGVPKVYTHLSSRI